MDRLRKDTQTVVDALIKNARELPQELYRSLTWDRGKSSTSGRELIFRSTRRANWMKSLGG
jgi:IS30 family transposase